MTTNQNTSNTNDVAAPTTTVYEYLIGFVANGGASFGSVTVTLPFRIAGPQSLETIRQQVQAAYNYPNLIVLSFSLFGSREVRS